MRQVFAVAGCAAITGLLFAAAIPPGDIQILGWLCFIPLIASLHGARLVYVLLAPLGSLLFAAYVTTTGILYPGQKLDGDSAWHYAGFMLFALAITPAFAALAALKKRNSRTLVFSAAAFVAAESLLLIYLPAHIALTMYRSPAALAAASLVGIWGISFILWLFQIWAAAHWRDWLGRFRQFSSRQRTIAVIGALLWTAIALWEFDEPDGPSVALPQANGRTRIGVIQSQDVDFDLLAKWNADAKREGAILVVWPELSAAGIAAGGRTEKLVELSRDPNQPAFVTTFPDSSKPKPYNAAVLFYAGGESSPYYKRRPFAGESHDHQAGTKPASAQFEEFAVGLNICFDSCYPYLLRETSRLKGVRLVALPCMGPESPYGVIQAIHGAFTPFRSAELGIPIARGESSAFAMITDANGRIVAQAPPGFQGLLVGDVEASPRWTLVRLFGDWFLYLCWLAVLFWILQSIKSALRRRVVAQADAFDSTEPSVSSS